MSEKMKIADLPVRAAIALIGFYRKHISPFTPPRCRYYPTCSQYAVEAFETHGFIKGFFLTVFRLLRCNPLFKGGYDPVPVRSSEKKRLSDQEKFKEK